LAPASEPHHETSHPTWRRRRRISPNRDRAAAMNATRIAAVVLIVADIVALAYGGRKN
jgi:hypothetical protein